MISYFSHAVLDNCGYYIKQIKKLILRIFFSGKNMIIRQFDPRTIPYNLLYVSVIIYKVKVYINISI